MPRKIVILSSICLLSVSLTRKVSLFQELIPESHTRWRTPFEHDVLLPQGMKEQGVPFTPSWNKHDPLPGQVAIRLKPGQALIRNGTTIHTGHTVPERERNTLSIGWSKWGGPPEDDKKAVADVRNAWQLDPEVREALPHEWMKIAWDRMAATQKLGPSLEDRYPGYDINKIKAGEVVGWRGDLERAAAAAGDDWKPFQTLDGERSTEDDP